MISYWTIEGDVARLSLSFLSATVQPRRPQWGVGSWRLGGESLSGVELFRLRPSRPVQSDTAPDGSDVYVRGCDLIATFEESPGFPIRWQIYWRALPGDGAAHFGGLETIVSAQTSLLDGNPQMRLSSCLPSTQCLRLVDLEEASFEEPSRDDGEALEATSQSGAGCFLTRLFGDRFSYVELVHPADFIRSRVSCSLGAGHASTSVLTLEHPLFPRRLEKGVILRARMRGHFVARDGDQSLAAALYREFAESEVPLTV